MLDPSSEAEQLSRQARILSRSRTARHRRELMKSGTRIPAHVAALLLGVAMSLAYAEGGMSESGKSFKDLDANNDGYRSVDEFEASGKDELAFKAADINGDERVDPDEFDKYLARKATDQATPGSGNGGQPKPAQPPSGY